MDVPPHSKAQGAVVDRAISADLHEGAPCSKSDFQLQVAFPLVLGPESWNQELAYT